jgi:hypothetical protein
MENSTENNNLQVEPTNKGGAPIGNQNGRKGKLFYDALKIALVQEDRKKLRTITDKLVKSAEAGEPWAIKEVMDRIDGKPVNTTELSGADNTPLKLVVAWEK